jgi:hypothetical protein
MTIVPSNGHKSPGMSNRVSGTITLNADGTTTTTGPNGRTIHSHSPPTAA